MKEKFFYYFSKQRLKWAVIGFGTVLLPYLLILSLLLISTRADLSAFNGVLDPILAPGLILHAILIYIPLGLCQDACLVGDHILGPTTLGFVVLLCFWTLAIAAISFRYGILARKLKRT